MRVDRFRVQINLDAYNVLNGSSIRTVNLTDGSRWRQPTQILDPRIIETPPADADGVQED